ncbi:2-oxo acid dehydrogenase subunit E2 [Brooklawnia sp.]|uniref:2-oxo acid dehydrogenase subunit E2 n=1 Tax=Brooklawnia sp. TaxID=2699740 RepID=UPI00311D3932
MAGIQAITLPKWGLTMEEGLLGSWHVAEGATFKEGDSLCTVESSKITNELSASFDGVLRRRIGKEGETYPVGALLAVSAPAEVSDAEVDAFIAASDAASTDTAQPAAAASAAPSAVPAAAAPPPRPGELVVPASLAGQTADDIVATPRALGFAKANGINLGKVSGSGRGGRVSIADVEKAITAGGGQLAAKPAGERKPVRPRSHADDSTVSATPVARKLAKKRGINLHDCRATGARGRVCRADVEEAIHKLEAGQPVAAAPATQPVAAAASVNEATPQPLTPMRRTIAERLQSSYQTSPHFRVNTEIIMDAALDLRAQINATVPGVKISVNDLIVKAVAIALTRVPDVNVQFDEASKTVMRFAEADISVAVALPEGLVTPVVRAANKLSLGQISAAIAELVTHAKARTLTAEQFQGGTFTVSNLGMYPVTSFDAIINPPQAAILAVGSGVRRLVVGDDDQVDVHTVVEVSLASDHRVIDGALAAKFVAQLRSILEAPAQMLV